MPLPRLPLLPKKDYTFAKGSERMSASNPIADFVSKVRSLEMRLEAKLHSPDGKRFAFKCLAGFALVGLGALIAGLQLLS